MGTLSVPIFNWIGEIQVIRKSYLAFAVLTMFFSTNAFAGAMRSGFNSSTLPRNDDGSTGLVGIGFLADFFGTPFTAMFVNNNGNVTIDAPQYTYTPYDLTSTGRQIIAPFFADVDTRMNGAPVTYGAGTVNGHAAFGVTWANVDCYSAYYNRVERNYFQLILIERSDTGPGNFDIEFNYDQIQWESGMASYGSNNCLGGLSARVGYSNGTGAPGTFFELSGSGVTGSFLDSNTTTGLIYNSLNSGVLGRYIFEAREGIILPPCSDDDDDGLCNDEDNCLDVTNADQLNSDWDSMGDVCDPCPFDAMNDEDADGVCGDVDNCEFTPNPNQSDNDLDSVGDECDPDDDNDGVEDVTDNCPLHSNSDQVDYDQDGVGDVCDLDDDNDGISDGTDACLNSPLGEVVDYSGCAISEHCVCEQQWKNHGAYVSCVAHISETFLTLGLITEDEKDATVSAAGSSECGHKVK